MNNKQAILAITGSDGTGGSGVQADIRCISELGGTVTSVVTSITVQNTLGIQEFYDLPATIVRKQIEAIFNDLQPQIVKIGLVSITHGTLFMRPYRHPPMATNWWNRRCSVPSKSRYYRCVPLCWSLLTFHQPFASTAKPTSCRRHWLIISVVARTPTKPCSMRAVI